VKSHTSATDDTDTTLAFQFPVQAPSQPASEESGDANCVAAVRAIGGMEPRPAIADAKLFEIVSELLAEGWVKATRKWRRDSHTPLRFDSIVPVQTDQPQHKPVKRMPVLRGVAVESQ
jgi:hypothetical protein